MKRYVAVATLLLAFAPGARADEASKRAKVQDLFATMHMDRMMSQMMDGIMAQMQQMMKGMPGSDQITPQQQKVLDDYQKRVYGLVMDNLGWKALEPQYTVLYANTYSEEEIDGILAFYKSPVGQAMLAKTPELTSKGMQISQARMVELQPRMNALIQTMTRDLAAATDSADGQKKKPSGK